MIVPADGLAPDRASPLSGTVLITKGYGVKSAGVKPQ